MASLKHKANHRFERLVVTEAQALELFKENPFKQHFIREALGGPTPELTVYVMRNGGG